MKKLSIVKKIMTDFADRTGLTGPEGPPRRYLWTDAFAVCNFLGLYLETGEENYRRNALKLVDQVHNILGKHRADDRRSGWISGLGEEEGRRHPTIGGLRIGKKLNERKPDESFDECLEWERDGQYFHYLTQWMHALDRMTTVTGDPKYNRWAVELARTAHAGFTHRPLTGAPKRMYWKMSIDLSYPLVSSMGQHDALEAFVTYNQLMATAKDHPQTSANLDLTSEIEDAIYMCRNINLATDDPLGIGGLLINSFKLAHLIISDSLPQDEMLATILHYALQGLNLFVRSNSLNYPPECRLPFREMGISIGLHAVERMQEILGRHPGNFSRADNLDSLLLAFQDYLPLEEFLENFWLGPANQACATWTEHLDINSVMLATSLAPGGYLVSIQK